MQGDDDRCWYDGVTYAPAVLDIIKTGGSLDIAEQGQTSDTFTVALASAPSTSVTISLADYSSPAQVTLSTDTLNFTTGNWSVPQEVTVTAIDDIPAEFDLHNTIITLTASGDAGYDGYRSIVDVSIADNDIVPLIGTYVDANSSNTVADDDSTPWYATPDDYDGLWGEYTGHGAPAQDGTFFEAASTEYAPLLRTAITDLTEGDKYEIRAVFGASSADADLHISAGLCNDDLTTYKRGDWLSQVSSVVASGSDTLYQMQILLGTATVYADGSVYVYVDSDDTVAADCWYDGITYKYVGHTNCDEQNAPDLFSDINDDCVVNLGDFAELAAEWLEVY